MNKKIELDGDIVKVLSDLSPENCMYAVRQDVNNIRYIPNPSAKCVEYCIENGCHLNYINPKCLTKKLWHIAVLKNYDKYNIMPVKYQDLEINTYVYLKKIKNNSEEFNKIPDDIKTPEFILEAVKTNHNVIKRLSDEQKTQEICEFCFKTNHDNLEFIPEQYQTEEMCLIAADNYYVQKYIKLDTPEIKKTIKKANKYRKNKECMDYDFFYPNTFYAEKFEKKIKNLKKEVELLRDEVKQLTDKKN